MTPSFSKTGREAAYRVANMPPSCVIAGDVSKTKFGLGFPNRNRLMKQAGGVVFRRSLLWNANTRLVLDDNALRTERDSGEGCRCGKRHGFVRRIPWLTDNGRSKYLSVPGLAAPLKSYTCVRSMSLCSLPMIASKKSNSPHPPFPPIPRQLHPYCPVR